LVHVSRLRATEKAIGVAPAPTAVSLCYIGQQAAVLMHAPLSMQRLSIIGSLAPQRSSKEEAEDRSLPLPLGADMAM
jgi:hypothetical protein